MGSSASQESTSPSRKYSFIPDQYESIEEVRSALRQNGLESSNLIIGIDFTKSNEWTGKKSFNGRSLHAMLGDIQNPYEQAISIIGRTLERFDEDNLIPCFGFGDVSTHDQSVFSFFPDGRPCNGIEAALSRYKELLPSLRLSGPTSFAPVINAAIDIVVKSRCQYHVLLIIADGQVTSSNAVSRQLSPQEQNTIDAIVDASKYPLSIVLVGVGDGPWDLMEQFDDNIPDRDFDNFQFVNFTKIMSKNIDMQQRESAFALAALMEIPSQFNAAMDLGLLNSPVEMLARVHPLPPPIGVLQPSTVATEHPQTSTFGGHEHGSQRAYSAASTRDSQDCPICYTNSKNLAFNCGHQTCEDCGKELSVCPLCRAEIQTRLRLY